MQYTKRVPAMALLLTIAFYGANAQVVSKEVCDRFAPGVVARLYEITRNRPMQEALQLKLAGRIQEHDSLVLACLKAGKTPAEIDNITRSKDTMLAVLDQMVEANYVTREAEKFAHLAVDGEMQGIRQWYNPDKFLYDRVKAIQLNRYKSLYRHYILNQYDTTRAEAHIAASALFYDTASYGLMIALCNKKYVDEYIRQLKELKPDIPDSIVQNIVKAFDRQKEKNLYSGNADILLNVIQHLYPDTAVVAHFYRADLERKAGFLSSAQQQHLIAQHVSKIAFDSVSLFLKEKNYQQKLLSYTYGSHTKLRDSLVKHAGLYYDSLVQSVMLRDGSSASTSQFSIALKYKTVLNLSPELIEMLVWHAQRVSYMHDSITAIDPYARADLKAYEAKYMNQLLTEEAYTRVLTIKNRGLAKSDAESDWAEMDSRGITFGLNKEETIKQLYNYYLLKWNAYYRLADEPNKQEANLALLKEEQPKALVMLAAAKKLPKPVNANTSLQIKW